MVSWTYVTGRNEPISPFLNGNMLGSGVQAIGMQGFGESDVQDQLLSLVVVIVV